jgi:tol-pal system protein YbgF
MSKVCTSMTKKTTAPGRQGAGGTAEIHREARQVRIALCLLLGGSLLSGCVAQQADLKQVDRDLQRRIKQSTEELAQTRARQNQEIVALKEQELPALRGELDRALHRTQVLETRQEDLQAKMESRAAIQDSKLEKRITESEKRVSERAAEEARRLGWAEQQLVNQERQMKADRDQTKSEIAALTVGIDQLRAHIDTVQKNLLDAVHKTNAALGQKVDGRLEEQQKIIHAVEHRQAAFGQLDAQNKSLTEQVGKLSQALGEFKQGLIGLGEKVGQQEQANKQLVAMVEQEATEANKRTDVLAERIDADNKATADYFTKVNRSVESMHKVLEQAGGKFVTRGDDQERRLDEVAKQMSHVQGQMQSLDKNLENQHGFLKQVEQHLQALDKNYETQHGFLKQVEQHLQSLDKNYEQHHSYLNQVEQHLQSLDKNYDNHQVFLKQVEQHLAARTASASRPNAGAVAEAATPPPAMTGAAAAQQSPQQPAGSSSPGAAHAGVPAGNAHVAAVGDREAYERILNRFKEGDLENARQGFADFLVRHPHSDYAPNARFWLGESYYGKKDYPKAIDAYDQVQLNHPTSEKVPAALLKKGYAYLALKDRKRAASALKQVIDLYPRSPEANKAIDKLNQLKELH